MDAGQHSQGETLVEIFVLRAVLLLAGRGGKLKKMVLLHVTGSLRGTQAPESANVFLT